MIFHNDECNPLKHWRDEYESDEEFEKIMIWGAFEIMNKDYVAFWLNIDDVAEQFYETLNAEWYEDMVEKISLKDEDWHELDKELDIVVQKRYKKLRDKDKMFDLFLGSGYFLSSKEK